MDIYESEPSFSMVDRIIFSLLNSPGAEVDDWVVFPHDRVQDPDKEKQGLLEADQLRLEPLAYEDNDGSSLLVYPGLGDTMITMLTLWHYDVPGTDNQTSLSQSNLHPLP